LDQFSLSSLEMYGFIHFNKILLSLLDVQMRFSANIEAEMCQTM